MTAVARAFATLLFTGAMAAHADAQDVFRGGSNSSNPTGTNGQQGNDRCAPPTVLENGRWVTPKNWSCDSSNYWARPTPRMAAPTGARHPGPAYVPGARDPCQPFGSGGYNWRANPAGTALPPGCAPLGPAPRAVTITKLDPHHEALPAGRERQVPMPPGLNHAVGPLPQPRMLDHEVGVLPQPYDKSDPRYDALPAGRERSVPGGPGMNHTAGPLPQPPALDHEVGVLPQPYDPQYARSLTHDVGPMPSFTPQSHDVGSMDFPPAKKTVKTAPR